MAADSAALSWADDEWEVCNDNGFVYKRRRRMRAEDCSGKSPQPSAAHDSEAEQRRLRRRRRKQCLLAIREKYRSELEQWERLSSSILSVPPPPPPPRAALPSSSSSSSPSPPSPPSRDAALEPLLRDLLLQAEAQEAVMRKLSELCDYVESVCEAEEDRLAQALLDLPIWGSPRSLIASLST